jgi:hypothetical protein
MSTVIDSKILAAMAATLDTANERITSGELAIEELKNSLGLVNDLLGTNAVDVTSNFEHFREGVNDLIIAHSDGVDRKFSELQTTFTQLQEAIEGRCPAAEEKMSTASANLSRGITRSADAQRRELAKVRSALSDSLKQLAEHLGFRWRSNRMHFFGASCLSSAAECHQFFATLSNFSISFRPHSNRRTFSDGEDDRKRAKLRRFCSRPI